MARKMKEYQSALENMNNEAVEYVRGVPVVKTFGQTVFSFKRFKGSIDSYHTWVVAYTKSLMWPMVAFTTAINCVFVPLIIAGLCFTAGGVDGTFLLNLIFYIIFTPIISVTLMKVMFMSENNMIVSDALQRIDGILAIKPLPEPSAPQTPKDNSVAFENVTFAYEGADRNAIDGITLHVRAGETVALVGPSGGGKTTAAVMSFRTANCSKLPSLKTCAWADLLQRGKRCSPLCTTRNATIFWVSSRMAWTPSSAARECIFRAESSNVLP